MTTANNPDNNLSPWKPGQSGNPSGRPRGTRDLAGYVLETTDGGKELVDALVSIARGVMPKVAAQEGSRPRKDQQVRPADQLKAIEMLLDRGFGGRSPQQLDIPTASLTGHWSTSLTRHYGCWLRTLGSLRKAAGWWLMGRGK